MNTLKTATDWAKAEVFSTSFFIVFGLAFVAASIGFWQLGRTDLARAYVVPTLVAGVLLLIIGSGLVYTNVSRTSQFAAAYHEDAEAFVAAEVSRVEGTLREYQTIVFTVVPLLIAACALLIAFFPAPVWRASAIATIAMLTVILLIDGTAHARITDYYRQLAPMDTNAIPSDETL
jgi:hypothetical protein